jgi:magnesium-transporting ATPase (P-type)
VGDFTMNRNTLAIGLLLVIATLVFSPFGILSFLLLFLFVSSVVALISAIFSPASDSKMAESPSDSN